MASEFDLEAAVEKYRFLTIEGGMPTDGRNFISQTAEAKTNHRRLQDDIDEALSPSLKAIFATAFLQNEYQENIEGAQFRNGPLWKRLKWLAQRKKDGGIQRTVTFNNATPGIIARPYRRYEIDLWSPENGLPQLSQLREFIHESEATREFARLQLEYAPGNNLSALELVLYGPPTDFYAEGKGLQTITPPEGALGTFVSAFLCPAEPVSRVIKPGSTYDGPGMYTYLGGIWGDAIINRTVVKFQLGDKPGFKFIPIYDLYNKVESGTGRRVPTSFYSAFELSDHGNHFLRRWESSDLQACRDWGVSLEEEMKPETFVGIVKDAIRLVKVPGLD